MNYLLISGAFLAASILFLILAARFKKQVVKLEPKSKT